MRGRGRGIAILAVAVVSLASWGFAAGAAEGFVWNLEETGALESGESETVSITLKPSTTVVISAVIGGVKFELTAKGLAGNGYKLGANGTDSGKLQFKEASLGAGKAFSECKLPSTLETNPLKGELVELSKVLYDKVVPTAGTSLMTFKVEGCKSAALNGTYELGGSMYLQTEPLETELVKQPLKEVNTGTLMLGAAAATMTMEATSELSGPMTGKKFWALVAAPKYKATAYPAFLVGSKLGKQVFDFDGPEFTCEEATFVSNLTAASAAIKISAAYDGCEGFGFIGASIDMKSCGFELLKPVIAGFNFTGNVNLVCTNGGDAMTFVVNGNIGLPVCEIEVGPQANLAKFELENKAGPPKWVKIKANLTTVTYSVTKSVNPCPLTLANGVHGGIYQGEFGLNPPVTNGFFIG